jgi:hypothetical protein
VVSGAIGDPIHIHEQVRTHALTPTDSRPLTPTSTHPHTPTHPHSPTLTLSLFVFQLCRCFQPVIFFRLVSLGTSLFDLCLSRRTLPGSSYSLVLVQSPILPLPARFGHRFGLSYACCLCEMRLRLEEAVTVTLVMVRERRDVFTVCWESFSQK